MASRSPCNCFIIWAILCTVSVLQVSAQSSSIVNSTVNSTVTPSATTSAAAEATTISPTATTASPDTTTAAPTTAKPTEKPATTKLNMKMRFSDEPYTASLSDTSSSAYINFVGNLTAAMEDEIGSGTELTVISIREGSIIVNFTVTLKVKPGVDLVKQLTAVIKSGKFGNFSVDPSYIVIVQNFPGVTLGDYKLNGTSYLAHCCKSTMGQFEMVRICTASEEATCYGITVKYEVDCGKAEGPPKCSKADTLTNMSVAIMILGYIFSKILPV